MRAVTTRAALTAVLLSFAPGALAHGPPPVATALLAHDAEGATIVQLSRGLARRTDDGFHYVCPESWGGDVTAPAVGLPGGGAVVASERLYLVSAAGEVTPHPSEVGRGLALASHPDGPFGLFLRGDVHELRRIRGDASELVRTLDEPFAALAASADALVLLSWTGEILVQQTVTLAGELGPRVTWRSPSVVAYAALRMADDTPYVVIWGSAAPWVALGVVGEHGFESRSEAGSDIAGPIARGAGTLWARDGVLQALDVGLPARADDTHLTCLGSERGLDYACAHKDLVSLGAEGLGAPLFELAALRAPDLSGLPEAARDACTVRWLDLQQHVTNGASDAGVEETGAPPDAAATEDLPDPATGNVSPDVEPGSEGCAVGAAPGSTGLWSALMLSLLWTYGSSRSGVISRRNARRAGREHL